MKTGAGLWIDHKKAIVVVFTEEGQKIRQILSQAEKNPGGPVIHRLKVSMPPGRCRRRIAAREFSRGFSIVTMTRSLRIFVMRKPF